MRLWAGASKIGAGEGSRHRVLISRCLKQVGGSRSSKQSSETEECGSFNSSRGQR